jgi:hypothetical protein
VNNTNWRAILIAALLVASVAEFAIRGPLRIARETNWNDFLSPYIQAKAWVKGEDPYSTQVFISEWPDVHRPTWVVADAASGQLELNRGIPTPYPLSSLVVVAPFTALSWSAAIAIWIVISVVAVVLSPFALISICDLRFSDLRSQIFVALWFAMGPLHTGMGTANPALLAVSLAIAAVWAEHRGKPSLSGILLGIAVCLKPTVAGGLLLYYMVRSNRKYKLKIAGIAGAVTAIITGLAVCRLTLAGVPWLSSYIENTRRIFAPGSLADFARPDAIRFNMINAQVLLYSILGNASLANRLAQSLGAALLAVWLWICYRRRRAPSELLEISAVLVLFLIPVYHRFYDATVLIWPLAWSLLRVAKRSTTVLIAVMVIPFLLPGPIILSQLAASGRIPASVMNGWWWNTIVLPHEVWDLILLEILLLYFMMQPAEESSGSTPSTAGSVAKREIVS